MAHLEREFPSRHLIDRACLARWPDWIRQVAKHRRKFIEDTLRKCFYSERRSHSSEIIIVRRKPLSDIRFGHLLVTAVALGWPAFHSEGALGRAHRGSGSLVRSLDNLERIRCLRMIVLVWVELNRQFAIKLGKILGLHRRHLWNEHLSGGIQNSVDCVSLFFGDQGIIHLHGNELGGLHISLLLNLLFHHNSSLSVIHKHRSACGHEPIK